MTDVTVRTAVPTKSDNVAAGFAVGDLMLATTGLRSTWVMAKDGRWFAGPNSRLEKRQFADGKFTLTTDEVKQSVTGVVYGSPVHFSYTLTASDITDLASRDVPVAVAVSGTEPTLVSLLCKSGTRYEVPGNNLLWANLNAIHWVLSVARGGTHTAGDRISGTYVATRP